jgi:hypothetical protein
VANPVDVAARLDAELRAANIPIHGVNPVDVDNKQTWRIDFKAGVTPAQQARAAAIVAAFQVDPPTAAASLATVRGGVLFADLARSRHFTATLDTDISVEFINIPAAIEREPLRVTFVFIAAGVPRSVRWPPFVAWIGGVPAEFTGGDGDYVVELRRHHGPSWVGINHGGPFLSTEGG